MHAPVFLREPERVDRTVSEWRHRLHGDNIVDHVVCLKAEFLWHTIISNENGEFYTYDIYPYLNRSVCLLIGSPTWWRFTFCSSGSSLVFWWRDAPLVREFRMWGRRCKQWDFHWFQGWGLLSQFSPFRYFPHFPLLSKQTFAIEYRVYISQVSPQLSCGDTCLIWMWFRESNRYFCKMENFAYGEISERSFSNPHPWTIKCVSVESGQPCHDNISWYI